MSPRRIVILGGGSTGWMAAAAFATGMPGAQVELVESEELGIIGVGEATFPSIRAFNRLLGIDEAEMLAATQGSFKLGIQFVDWRAKGEHYFHTFGDFGPLDGPMALWGQYRRVQEQLGGELGDHCLPTVMAREGRFRVPDTEGDAITARFDCAYHFDAVLYAGFLRRLAERRGARRIEGKVVDVARHPDGRIAHLKLADGREVAGDFFVDCSGFASLLLGKTLGVPFVDFSRWLPVDRAWAVPAERPDGPLTPYTRSTAQEAGWTWRIPLRERCGHGHVFASKYIDEDRAREQLLAQVDGRPLAEPRLLRFATGHRAQLWSHNVVGLGLAAGFLEPLESTAIFLVHNALGRLIPLMLQPGGATPEAAEAFSDQQVRQYRRIRDFIILHYCLTERRDSELWRYMAALELPESLAYKIHAWRETGALVGYDDEGFDRTSWLAVFAGMRHWPKRVSPWMQEVPEAMALQYLRQRRAALASITDGMPDHDTFLQHVVARAAG